MIFRGLFIGIDRFASPRIDWLGCARRDAVALHALFSDTLGGESVLLTDEAATRAAIEYECKKLSQCDADDVVVIAFSGHGSETHELVTYDADLRSLETTCIPLDLLTQWFSEIPAHRVICILDCCFSGGMGAKVLKVDAVPRGLQSVEDLLEQLKGPGRLIVTASSATEPAWENSKIGHGLLTYHLLEGLQGAEEVRQSGQVSVYRLLEYVTQRVIDDAAKLGKPQHPTVRGQLDGELTWPVFEAGEIYYRAFPERGQAPVTSDVHSLAVYGFPDALLDVWKGSIPTLNQLQLDAINEFNLLRGDHLVVSAPTSSGKTMIGELAALKGALDHRRSLFLLPLKALVNDKHQQFTRMYGPFGVRTIRATGDSVDPELMRGQYDICLMTYETFAAIALGNPHILEQVGTVVVDEVQMIADASRGVNLEFVLTLLRMRRRQGIEPQVVALSAVIGDTNGLERWLDARLLKRVERPVPLDEGLLLADGTFRYISSDTGEEKRSEGFIQRQWGKDSSQSWVIPLVQRLVGEGKQVIVFREIRGEARGCALYLARELGLASAEEALRRLPTGDPSLASEALKKALDGGVAFHISDLERAERQVIEEEFRAPDSTIRVIVATTTLAMGVNTPAEAVVVAGLVHPGPVPVPYAVAEYKNIVGRAGRLGFAERGSSFLLALSPKDEHEFWQKYVMGQPEDLLSRFLSEGTDPRSLILRVLVAAPKGGAEGLTPEAIVNFLENSFGAFQRTQSIGQWSWDRQGLLQALSELEAHRLVERDAQGKLHLTELGRLCGQGGVEVESMIRVVEALAPLPPDSINDPTLLTVTQLTTELDALNFPINKASTNSEPQAWSGALRQQQVPEHVLRTLQRWITEKHQGTLRAKKAAACLLWITDMPMSEVESVLTRFGGKFDGAAGPTRSLSSRTADLLGVVARVAEILHPELNLGERPARLLVRLEMGVPSQAVDLARRTGLSLTRGDYQRMMKAGLSGIDVIEASPDEPLLACIEGDVQKLAAIRAAVFAHRAAQEVVPVEPLLPPYES